MNVSVAKDLNLAPFGKEVYNRNAHSVQTTGSLIRTFFEFSAKLEDRHHAFQRGNFSIGFFRQLFVPIDWNSSTIIFNGHRPVGIDLNRYRFCETGHGFINRIVYDFVDQMMQASPGRVANVHTRTFANVFQIRKMLQILRRVFGIAIRRHRSCCFLRLWILVFEFAVFRFFCIGHLLIFCWKNLFD